jgi:hypothetical protein
MPSNVASSAALRRLFKKKPVADLTVLRRALKTDSRMTVFRHLKQMGYRSSYTHAGRYYTLVEIPQFDDYGLWLHQGVGFSKAGTLKDTVAKLVEEADAGRSPSELEQLLCVRVRNTLVTLTREAKIGRELVRKVYVYVSAAPKRAARQLSERREQLAEEKEVVPLNSATIIEILVEAIQIGPTRVAPQEVANRLTSRGVAVSTQQVQLTFVRYGLDPEKKGD